LVASVEFDANLDDIYVRAFWQLNPTELELHRHPD
jgi:hypothetical protein